MKQDNADLNDGFPERLKLTRTQKGMSQTDLAKIIGIHYNQIGRYEQGTSRPTAANISKLAEALDVSADYLFKGEIVGAVRANFEDQEFLQLFQKATTLPEQDKSVLKRIIDVMVNQKQIDEMATSK